MVDKAQTRAVQRYRGRLAERGLARFEILASDHDRELIKTLARRLAEPGPRAEEVRSAVSAAIAHADAPPGRIFAALRRSPLDEINLERTFDAGRDIEW